MYDGRYDRDQLLDFAEEFDDFAWEAPAEQAGAGAGPPASSGGIDQHVAAGTVDLPDPAARADRRQRAQEHAAAHALYPRRGLVQAAPVDPPIKTAPRAVMSAGATTET